MTNHDFTSWPDFTDWLNAAYGIGHWSAEDLRKGQNGAEFAIQVGGKDVGFGFREIGGPVEFDAA